MQQQFFKRMEQPGLVSKPQPISKINKPRSQVTHKKGPLFVDFELSEQQQQAIQAKLPKGFFIINPFNGDLQKLRNDFKSSFIQKDLTASKHNSVKAKKEQRKHQHKQKTSNKNQDRKPVNKEEQKSVDNQKTKRIKKQLKSRTRKHQKQRVYGGQQQKQKQGNHEADNLVQNIEFNEEMQEEIVQKEESVKQKKKDKVEVIEKQVTIFVKPQASEAIKQPQQIKAEQLNMPSQFTIGQEVFLLDNQIPLLANNALRYDPRAYEGQTVGTLVQNNLRFFFGLSYHGPMNETVLKLDEKQKKFCNNLLQRLKNHRSSQAFRVRVDPVAQGVPDYHSVVYTPMDLRTIEKKVNKDRYQNISQFHADINMIFLNSYKYNLRETVYFQATVQFQDYYQEMLREAQKKPFQYLKQLTTKTSKPKYQQESADYTDHPNKKIAKKKTDSQRQGPLAKSQILQRKNVRLSRNKSFVDDQSLLVSQSLAMDTVNEFNGAFQSMIQEQNTVKQQEIEGKDKIRRLNSLKISRDSFKSLVKQQNQQKAEHETKGKKTLKRQQSDQFQKKTHYEKPAFGRKPAKDKLKTGFPVSNDDYNEEDNQILDKHSQNVEAKMESTHDRVKLQFMEEIQKEIKSPTKQIPSISKQSLKSITEAIKHEHSIIVNNINTHPQSIPCNTFHSGVDILTSNSEHPNSGATVALTCVSTPLEAKAPSLATKPKKNKSKKNDEDYRCSSDEEYVIESSRAHIKRPKEKKIGKSHKSHMQSSASGDNYVKRRGRHAKKNPFQKAIKQQNPNKEDQKAPQSIPRNLQDVLQIQNNIPEVQIPHNQGHSQNNDSDSIFMENQRAMDQNLDGINFYNEELQ